MLHIIYLNNKTMLSKKNYKNWQEIQNDFNDYKTSLSYSSIESVIDFLKDDWNINDKKIKEIINFYKSNKKNLILSQH